MIDLLVVDDEVGILEGLEHQLRGMRGQWRMQFALGGAAALAALDARRFDVVISDMRMPGVDGIAVLERVRERHPEAVRLILSGEVGPGSLDRLLATAHQVLTKPCPPPRLRSTVERALAVRDAVHDPAVRALVTAVGELPPAPRLWMKIGELLRRADVGAGTLAEVLAEDPALTARLIRLAGSVGSGARRISSVVDAVRVLGTDAVHALVLSLELGGTRADPALERIYAHGLVTAHVTRALARPADVDAAFAAGAMHDLGAVVLTVARPAQLAALRERARREERPLVELERAELGASHAEVGAYLLGLWGMPQPLVEAAAFHHDPGRLPGELGLAGAVYLANLLVADGHHAEPDGGWLARAGVAGELPRWRKLAAPYLAAS
ncbi:MAG TPA: HDOD domain-containing protein [Kofleriaceae bacterium]|nr:HDOD domain-containing protein [Kofleriaceae bacterium]